MYKIHELTQSYRKYARAHKYEIHMDTHSYIKLIAQSAGAVEHVDFVSAEEYPHPLNEFLEYDNKSSDL